MTLQTYCLRGDKMLAKSMYQVYFIESITLDLCTYGSAVFFTLSVSQVDQSSLQVLLARQVGFRAIHGI